MNVYNITICVPSTRP